MKDFITFVGLDVHKNSIDVALADGGREGEVRYYGSIGGDRESLDRLIRKLVSTGDPPHRRTRTSNHLPPATECS